MRAYERSRYFHTSELVLKLVPERGSRLAAIKSYPIEGTK